jgi:hypothetical protein
MSLGYSSTNIPADANRDVRTSPCLETGGSQCGLITSHRKHTPQPPAYVAPLAMGSYPVFRVGVCLSVR